MADFGFDAASIEDLADRLMAVLGVRLHKQMSPMIGTWYTDVDLAAAVKALGEGRPPPSGAANERFQLVYNDPEPGYTAPEFPGGGKYLLRAKGSAEELADIESKFRMAGLEYKRRDG